MLARKLQFPLLVTERFRQSRAISLTHSTSALPILEKSDLKASPGPRPRTLFILGSGESVLHLRTEHWSQINQAVSIGIGAWSIHPFVPNYLALEHIEREPERDGIFNGETALERSYREALEGWHLRHEVQERGPKILFFRPPIVSDLRRLVPLEGYWEKNTFLYGRIGSSSPNLNELQRELTSYIWMAKSGMVPFSLPFDTGATVIRLVFLAALAGYQRIVLAGVDLRESRFFWEAQPNLLRDRGMSTFFTPETRAVHSTEISGRFPVSEVLPLVSKAIRKAFGARLMVAHKKSWVSTILPVFDWE